MPFTLKLTYKGKPLSGKDNELYYGCMTDLHVLYLQIQSTKTVGGGQVTRSICSCSLPMSPSPVRPGRGTSDHQERPVQCADIGSIWLQKANENG